MQTVKTLTTRLSNYYWSPVHPREYIFQGLDGLYGIGLVAHLNYGAFNLTWAAMKGKMNTPNDQLRAAKFFKSADIFVRNTRFRGEPLETWLTLMSYTEFKQLMQVNIADFSPHEKDVLETCL